MGRRVKRWFVAVVLLLGCDPTRPTYQGTTATCDPVLDPEQTWIAAVSCSDVPCKPVVTQSGCDFSLAFEGCDRSTLIATIDDAGALDFESSASFGNCVASTEDGLHLVCDECMVDVVAREAPRPLEVESVALYDVPFVPPSDFDLLDSDDSVDGYALSIARAGDNIVVSTNAGEARQTRCRSRAAELVFVDRTTLATTSTAAPTCLSFITDDPSGDGFLGLYGGDEAQVGRFDTAGRLVASAVLPVTPDANGTKPSAMITDASRGVVYAAYDHSDVDALVRIDAATLTATVTNEITGRIRGIAAAGDFLAVSERVEGLVHVLDPSSLEVLRAVPLVVALRPSDDAGDVYWSSAQNRLFVTSSGFQPAIWVFDGPLVPGDAPRFLVDPLEDTVAWGFVDPIEPGAIWSFGVGPPPDYEAWLLELDPTGPRFAPRATLVGRGVATDVLVDGDTRWVLSGWSAELLRIRRR